MNSKNFNANMNLNKFGYYNDLVSKLIRKI